MEAEENPYTHVHERLEDVADMDDLVLILLHVMQMFPHGLSLDRLCQQIRALCKRKLDYEVFNCRQLLDILYLEPLASIFPVERPFGCTTGVMRGPMIAAIPSRL